MNIDFRIVAYVLIFAILVFVIAHSDEIKRRVERKWHWYNHQLDIKLKDGQVYHLEIITDGPCPLHSITDVLDYANIIRYYKTPYHDPQLYFPQNGVWISVLLEEVADIQMVCSIVDVQAKQ